MLCSVLDNNMSLWGSCGGGGGLIKPSVLLVGLYEINFMIRKVWVVGGYAVVVAGLGFSYM